MVRRRVEQSTYAQNKPPFLREDFELEGVRQVVPKWAAG